MQKNLVKFSRMIPVFLSFILVTASATAKTYFVSQKMMNASDKNEGTEQKPFKTIQKAVETARSGDTVLVKAGVYHETVTFKASGEYNPNTPIPAWGRPVPERIVLAAYRNDQVVLDGSEPIDRALWKPVKDRKAVYVAPVKTEPTVYGSGSAQPTRLAMVFLDGRRLDPNMKRDTSGIFEHTIPGSDDKGTWYYDNKAHNLYVNTGGQDPRKEGLVEAAVRNFAIFPLYRRNITIRGLTMRRFCGQAIEATRTVGLIIEDCHIHDAGSGMRVGTSDLPIVRRCLIHDVEGRGIDGGDSIGPLIYDNIVHSFWQDWFRVHNGYSGTAYTNFSADFVRMYHNIAIQPEAMKGHGGGYWPDVHCPGHFYVGNAAVNCATGFYIEAPSMGNVVQWNTAVRNKHGGIQLSANAKNVVCDNLLWENGHGLGLSGTESQLLLVAHNLFSHNWLKGNRTGINIGPEPGGNRRQTLNYAQDNIYDVPKDGIVARWVGVNYKTVDEFRKATGQEPHGIEATIDLDELDLIWVRVDDMDNSHEPIPMFGNSSCQKSDSWRSRNPLFWRRGDAEGTDSYPVEWTAQVQPDKKPYTYRGSFLARGRKATACTHWGMTMASVEGTPVGARYLNAGSLTGRAFDARGAGWWSPSLPVVGGATLDVALWMKTENIEAKADDGGAVVYVEWTDWTGQNKLRSYLVGGEAREKPLHPDLNRGSHDWVELAGSVTAPRHARRFALYMGARSCTGMVYFDAIRKLAVRPGDAPAGKAAPKQKESKPLLDPKVLAFKFVDLSGVVNRALADPQADDGVGGWSDQGPGFDMLGLEMGRQIHEDIPMMLLKPKTCVVLASFKRPQSKLPRQVTIPVGDKADILYFLHSGAWLTPHQRHWTYIVHYEDGTTESIPVVAGMNVHDWSDAANHDFANTSRMRTVLWPQIVGNTLGPNCGVYRTEWLNPKPDKVIQSVDMVAEKGGGVPILLGITLGRLEKAE